MPSDLIDARQISPAPTGASNSGNS